MGKFYCHYCFKSFTRFSSLKRHKLENSVCSKLHAYSENPAANLGENQSEDSNSVVGNDEFYSNEVPCMVDEMEAMNEEFNQEDNFGECSSSLVENLEASEECDFPYSHSNSHNSYMEELIVPESSLNDIYNLLISDVEDCEEEDTSETIDNQFWLYENTNTKSKLTECDHISLILGFAIRHKLSEKAVDDLVKLVDLHFPSSITRKVLTSRAMKKKVSNWMPLEVEVIEYCETCYAMWPKCKEEYQCNTLGCNGLRYEGEDQSRQVLKSYFIKSNLKPQLKTILERPGMWKKVKNSITKRMNKQTLKIEDILDGEICKSHPILSTNPNSISFVVDTDGVALFKSSRVDIWPVYLTINEIPRSERFDCKNVCLWGVWQGRGKPPTNAFFKPFVEDMKNLLTEGFQISVTFENQIITESIVAVPIVMSMDLIAKAPFLNMVQHNGKFGCCTCLVEGQHVQSGKGKAHRYSYNESLTVCERTSTSVYNDGVKAVDTSASVNGIKGLSMLHMIPYFDIVNGIVPDYMHGVLLGITKMLLNLWFDASEHKIQFQNTRTYPEYFIGHMVDDVDSRLLQMKPPSNLTRRPRPLKGNINNFKANELRSWLLYYSLPCLKGILPELYWNHFGLLVEALHILLGSSITFTEIESADICLKMFYKEFEDVYEFHNGKCGLNVHNLLHFTKYVRMCGPLWAWSCFPFEGFNGTIMSHVHGTKNVCRQIMESFNTIRNVYALVGAPSTTNDAQAFLKGLLFNKQSCCWVEKNDVFTLPNSSTSLSGEENALLGKFSLNCSKKFLRAEIKGQLYCGTDYTRNVKTSDSFCMAVNEGQVSVIRIKSFLYDEEGKKLFAYGNIVKRKQDWIIHPKLTATHLMLVENGDSENVIVEAASILEKIFFLDGNKEFLCIAKMVNDIEKD